MASRSMLVTAAVLLHLAFAIHTCSADGSPSRSVPVSSSAVGEHNFGGAPPGYPQPAMYPPAVYPPGAYPPGAYPANAGYPGYYDQCSRCYYGRYHPPYYPSPYAAHSAYPGQYPSYAPYDPCSMCYSGYYGPRTNFLSAKGAKKA